MQIDFVNVKIDFVNLKSYFEKQEVNLNTKTISLWEDFLKGTILETLIRENKKTSHELRMLSSVTLNCQATKIVMNSGSQLSEL